MDRQPGITGNTSQLDLGLDTENMPDDILLETLSEGFKTLNNDDTGFLDEILRACGNDIHHTDSRISTSGACATESALGLETWLSTEEQNSFGNSTLDGSDVQYVLPVENMHSTKQSDSDRTDFGEGEKCFNENLAMDLLNAQLPNTGDPTTGLVGKPKATDQDSEKDIHSGAVQGEGAQATSEDIKETRVEKLKADKAQKPSPRRNWIKSYELPPCKVCGGKGTGFHYGVNSCESCKVR